MARRKHSANTFDLKALVATDQDPMKALMREALQQVRESEMTERVGAKVCERTEGHRGYRAVTGNPTAFFPLRTR